MSNRPSHSHADMPNGISLLISILVRYPEIGTINFNPRLHAMKFTFLLTEALTAHAYTRFKDKLVLSLETMGLIDNRHLTLVQVEQTTFDGITRIELTRDVDSVTREEISLIIQLFRQEFAQSLVTDRNDSVMEEDLQVQEELIDNMLEDLRDTQNGKNFIAFREEGKVMVFNK